MRKGLKDNLEDSDFPSECLHLSALQRPEPTQLEDHQEHQPSGAPIANVPARSGSLEVKFSSNTTDISDMA